MDRKRLAPCAQTIRSPALQPGSRPHRFSSGKPDAVDKAAATRAALRP